jgi:hypothetical protein
MVRWFDNSMLRYFNSPEESEPRQFVPPSGLRRDRLVDGMMLIGSEDSSLSSNPDVDVQLLRPLRFLAVAGNGSERRRNNGDRERALALCPASNQKDHTRPVRCTASRGKSKAARKESVSDARVTDFSPRIPGVAAPTVEHSFPE